VRFVQVFLSWSGAESQRAAEALKPWLQRLFPDLGVWMSAHDIEAGTAWATVLHEQLKQTDFGLLCLTEENLTAPWILYEAGALALSSKAGCVVPLLLDVAAEKVPSPLAQLQSVRADEEGLWKVARGINAARDGGTPDEHLRERYEGEWPGLAQALGLDINTCWVGDVLVVTPARAHFLDEDAIRVFQGKMLYLIRQGHTKILIDLAAVTTLMSSGLGALLAAAAQSRKREARLVLTNVQPSIQAVFRMTGMLEVFKCVPTVDEALAGF
jgi:anti-anti-sigma factor